jgi:cytoskeletal protein CcmA (bactofilin family)
MFEIGKKGTDKNQDSASREERRPGGPAPETAAAAVRRPSGSREAAVIGPSIHIDGDLRGEEDLTIDGEVNGTVQLKNNSLTIGTQGKVRADVYAHSIHVEGYLEGDLYGSERVNIRKSAQLRGNITSPRVSLEDGARFKGSIEMDPQAVEAALGTRRGPSSSTNQGPGGQKPSGGSFNTGGSPGKTEASSGAKRG